jgi:hypothetical protein
MTDTLKIENTTIVTGLTSEQKFLVAELNNKHVGIPIYKFSQTTPNIELLDFIKTDFYISNSTIYENATSYGASLALTINNSSFAFPIYKVSQIEENFINLRITSPTVVLSSYLEDKFAVIKLDKEYYGIPIGDFEGEFMVDEVKPASSINVKTNLSTNIISDVIPDAGGTHLNPKIKTYSLLIDRIKRTLGWPNININICDENIVTYIDQAMEYYTKYAGYTEEYLMFSTNLYKRGIGIRLDELFSTTPEMRNGTYTKTASASFDYDLQDYRKVIDVFSFEQGEGVGINTLFTLEQAMVQQTYYGYMLGNTGFDLITWEVLKGWLDTRKKVLAQTPLIRFDNRTQIMRIIPEPYNGQQYVGVVGCYVERPVKDLIAEPWVVEYTTALTSIALGRIYGKFTNMSLPIGGGSINYGDLLQYGLKRKEELEKELYTGYGLAETAPPSFFVG